MRTQILTDQESTEPSAVPFLEFAKSVIEGIRTESVTELEILAREHAWNEFDLERDLMERAHRAAWDHVQRRTQPQTPSVRKRHPWLEQDAEYEDARIRVERARAHRAFAEEDLREVLATEREHGPSDQLNREIIRLSGNVEHAATQKKQHSTTCS